jgi:hypothetical protein
MHQLTVSSLSGSLADRFASRIAAVGDATESPVEVIADALAWINDNESNDVESYPGPGWSDSFDPSPADWLEYSAWSRTLDGGCGVEELSPEEKDLLCHSSTAHEYWDMVHEMERIQAERDAEIWS